MPGEEQERLGELAAVLARIDDPAVIGEFLMELFTPAEQKDIASRWELVKRLEQGVSQRKIASDLGLSLCKITRGSRELKKEGSVFRSVLAIYREISEVQKTTGKG
jgi:TrpR family trp operon transcriptional repressor